MENREIEVRFIEVDKQSLIKKLNKLGAKDNGEELIREIIFYDKEMKWPNEDRKFIRLRQDGKGNHLTFKRVEEFSATGTMEIEVDVDNWHKVIELMEEIGLVAFREQEKKRHSFCIDEVDVDIIDWPKIPTTVELEGKSEDDLKSVAEKLELDWKDVRLEDNRWIIDNIYKIPVTNYRYFTFNRQE